MQFAEAPTNSRKRPASDRDLDELGEDRFANARAINEHTQKLYSANYYRILAARKQLPMWSQREAIIQQVSVNPITLLVGETGSGKSTQLPQFCFESNPKGRIVCTQPRRVAAISVATRVAEEMDTTIPGIVGYNVRFDNQVRENTKIVYMTDGMLLREMMHDPDLTNTSIVLVDEAHERSVDTDILLGMLKRLLVRRPDMRIVVMSATLDTQLFSMYFDNPPLVRVPGRLHPVELCYTSKPVKDYVTSAVDFAWHIHTSEDRSSGDILVFLLGEREIERAVGHFRRKCEDHAENTEGRDRGGDRRGGRGGAGDEEREECPFGAKVLPLYGSLPLDEQRRVFIPAPRNVRKIIFSTNIAETSVTIDGVVYVIDCGFVKQTLYDPDKKTSCLVAVPTSQAAANQRKGRAGRTRPGKCYRMYPEEVFTTILPAQTYPEIVRTDLTNTVLQLFALGVTNCLKFDYVSPPAPNTIAAALEQLVYLGAVDECAQLTPLGRLMAALPLDVCTARAVIRAAAFECSTEMCAIAAMIEHSNHIFVGGQRNRQAADAARERFHHLEGDVATLFNVWMEFLKNSRSPSWCHTNFINYRTMMQVMSVHEQLRNMLIKANIPLMTSVTEGRLNPQRIRRAILEGFFIRCAFLPTGSDTYLTVREKQAAKLERSSVLNTAYKQPKFVVYRSMEMHDAEPFMTVITPVDVDWLPEVSPDFFEPTEICVPEAADELRQAFARKHLREQAANVQASPY